MVRGVNGIHDLGGMDGFGPITVERDEPVFHAEWERRAFGLTLLARWGAAPNLDAFRHAIETLDPVDYLTLGYYGRWLVALERRLVQEGVLSGEELETGRAVDAAEHSAEPGGGAPPAAGFLREIAAEPRFAVGSRVRARNHQPHGHTRLPGYARGKLGRVVRVYPACVFPDANAHGRGEQPQYVYAVAFSTRELWGEGGDPHAHVHVDLFESYLEPEEGNG